MTAAQEEPGRGYGEALLVTRRFVPGVSEQLEMVYRIQGWAGADLYFWGEEPSFQQVLKGICEAETLESVASGSLARLKFFLAKAAVNQDTKRDPALPFSSC